MAKTTRWTGGHASSNNWSQAANWDNGVPVAGDTLEFAGTTRLTPNNDIAADTSFAAITFISGAGEFTIGGNRITLAGAITSSDDSTQTVSLAMILGAVRTFACTSGNIICSGIISGAGGGITKTGNYTLTLSGVNTYGGVTTISAGTLTGTNTSSIGTGEIKVNGGTLQILNNGAGSNGTINISNNLTVNSGFTGTIYVANNGSNTGNTVIFPLLDFGGSNQLNITGGNGYKLQATAITMGGSNITTVNPTTADFLASTITGTTNFARTLNLAGTSTGNIISGVISNGVNVLSLTKTNSGTWTLSGVNTCTGAITISAGILTGNNTSAFGTGEIKPNGGTLRILINGAGSDGVINFANALVLNTNFTGTIDVNNNGSNTGNTVVFPSMDLGGSNALNVTGGNGYKLQVTALTLGGDGTTVFNPTTASFLTSTAIVTNDYNRTFTLGGAAVGNIISGTMADRVGGVYKLTILKTGTGTWTLSGANTYTGTTTISEGVLIVTGSVSAGSAVSVTGTLGGTGNVYGAITVNSGGTMAPGVGGTTIGTLGTAAVTFNTTSTCSVDLDGTIPTFDKINSSGTVALGAAANTLTVASIANSAIDKVYTIIGAASLTGTFSGMPESAIIYAGGRYLKISYVGNNCKLTDVAGNRDHSQGNGSRGIMRQTI